VPPAGVEGDVEVWVVRADRLHDLVGRPVEPIEIDREVIEPSGEAMLEKPMRAFPDGNGREEAAGGFGFGRRF
jgi:hypothetical protein